MIAKLNIMWILSCISPPADFGVLYLWSWPTEFNLDDTCKMFTQMCILHVDIQLFGAVCWKENLFSTDKNLLPFVKTEVTVCVVIKSSLFCPIYLSLHSQYLTVLWPVLFNNSFWNHIASVFWLFYLWYWVSFSEPFATSYNIFEMVSRWPWLSYSLLCRPVWPQTHRDPSARFIFC